MIKHLIRSKCCKAKVSLKHYEYVYEYICKKCGKSCDIITIKKQPFLEKVLNLINKT